MTRFIGGLILGASLMAIAAQAGNLYDRSGNVQAPAGSQQKMDYFRQRGQQLDIQHLRQQADRQRLERQVNPCAK